MIILDGNDYVVVPPEEEVGIRQGSEQADREYWQTTPYGVAVANEIHKKYSLDDENALHRQKDEKPEEYAEYYAYCEQCKAYVKERKGSA